MTGKSARKILFISAAAVLLIMAAGMDAEECERTIESQFWRFSEDLVIRFNLTGGTKLRDYPHLDFDKIRTRMPPVLECQFAIKAGKKWILR